MKTKYSILLISCVLCASVTRGAENSFARPEPIDLRKMVGNSQIFLVGDDHTQPAIKKFLEYELPSLRRLGFSCLAFEMLPENFQADLNTWSAESQERIRQHLVMAWGEKGPGIPATLFSLIKSAKEQGMNVMALDPLNASQLSRLEVNPYWATCIKNCLSKNCRMIVFAGRSHVDPKPGSLYSLLKKDGLSLSVIEFSGLEAKETAQMDLKTARLLGNPPHPTTLVTLEGYQTGIRQNFMVPSPMESQPQFGSNWIVNLASLREAAPLLLAFR